MHDRMFVYLPKHHPLAYEESVHITQLEQDSILLLRESQSEAALPPSCLRRLLLLFRAGQRSEGPLSKNMGYAILPGLMALDNLYVETGLVAVFPWRTARSLSPCILPTPPPPLNANESAVAQAIRATCRNIQHKLKELPSAPCDADSQIPSIYY